MCEALAKDGHRVTVWASDDGQGELQSGPPQFDDIRVEFYKMRFKALSRTLNSPIVPSLMKTTSHALTRFDVVHLHGYWVTFAPFVAGACLRAQKPLVLQPHGSLVSSSQKRLFKMAF